MAGQALIYCRISADPEGRAIGVERQETDCRELAERLGFTVAGVYVENDVSASTNTNKPRPKYAAMTERVRAGGIAAVLAYSNSRLTRRPMELEDVLALHKATGVRVATYVSGEDNLSTADGRMVARFKAVADAAEAERTAERVRRAKRENVEKGTYRGGPRPFGYERDGVTLRPAEAEAVRDAVNMVLDGVSLGRIAEQWRAAGIVTDVRTRRDGTTFGGNPIRPTDIGRILRRPRNAGLLDHRGTLSAAVWAPLVSREQWEAVCAVLNDPRRRSHDTDGRPRWLLTGIAVCGVCGQTMRHGVNGTQPNYRCRGKACTMRNQEQVDELVRGVIAERLRRPDLSGLLRVVDSGAIEEAAELRRTVNGLETRLDALAADINLSERMLAKRAAALEADLDTASTRLDALNAATVADGPTAGVLSSRDPAAAFLGAGLDTQRAVVATLVSVTFMPAKRGRPSGWKTGQPYFDPETVDIEWRTP